MRTTARLFVVISFLATTMPLTGCQSGGGGGGGGVTGNDNGSEPINESESNDYKKALVRCYKTGGTRIVKIMGSLRCY